MSTALSCRGIAHVNEGEHLLQQRVQQLRMAPGEAGHLHFVERCQECAAEGLVRPLCCRARQQTLDQLPLHMGEHSLVNELFYNMWLRGELSMHQEQACSTFPKQQGPIVHLRGYHACGHDVFLHGFKSSHDGEQQHLPGHQTGHLLLMLGWPDSLFQAAQTVSASGHRPGSAFSRRAD